MEVYNFTVDTLHTYAVGTFGVVVHNVNCSLTGILSDDDVIVSLTDHAINLSKQYTSPQIRPNTATIINTVDGYTITRHGGHSGNRVIVKDRLGNQREHTFNYACGEIGCMIHALENDYDLKGAQGATVDIRGPIDSPPLTHRAPCEARPRTLGCKTLIDELGMDGVE